MPISVREGIYISSPLATSFSFGFIGSSKCKTLCDPTPWVVKLLCVHEDRRGGWILHRPMSPYAGDGLMQPSTSRVRFDLFARINLEDRASRRNVAGSARDRVASMWRAPCRRAPRIEPCPSRSNNRRTVRWRRIECRTRTSMDLQNRGRSFARRRERLSAGDLSDGRVAWDGLRDGIERRIGQKELCQDGRCSRSGACQVAASASVDYVPAREHGRPRGSNKRERDHVARAFFFANPFYSFSQILFSFSGVTGRFRGIQLHVGRVANQDDPVARRTLDHHAAPNSPARSMT